jgi:ribonucleoside-triphosphate reductase
MVKIQKRNGDFVDFDKEKIINAINKAFIELDGELYETDTAEAIANEIEDRLERYTITDADKNPLTYYIDVEKIQDWVENALMKSEQHAVARAYIRYRYKREIARKQKTDFMEAVAEKLEARNPEGQNANVDECSFGGRMGEANRVLTKQYALDYLLSEKAKNNHLNNRIYIHDLDNYSVGNHNCLSIPFDDLLAKGFNTRQADVRPANSINTACQLLAVIFQVQSLQQFGGVSATHMDWTLAPYVKKSFYKHYIDGLTYIPWGGEELITKYNVDSFFRRLEANPSIDDEYFKGIPEIYYYAKQMTERETRQGMEGLIHNLNTL